MNTTQPESTALQTVSAPEEPRHVSANSLMMNPEAMDRVMRMAEMMASGKSTIPNPAIDGGRPLVRRVSLGAVTLACQGLKSEETYSPEYRWP